VNGRLMLKRLLSDARGRRRLSPAVINWIEYASLLSSTGEDPARAFGFIVTAEAREERDDFLREAVARMPDDWSTSRRAKRMREVARRVWVFANDDDRPDLLQSSWEASVLSALEAAPLPSDRQLRKIVGRFRKECQDGRVTMNTSTQ